MQYACGVIFLTGEVRLSQIQANTCSDSNEANYLGWKELSSQDTATIRQVKKERDELG